jgi:hypothetical protein
MEIINLKTRPDLKGTLSELSVGVEYVIESEQFKVMSVRNCATKLKDEGYVFKITETGMKSGCKVTRLA